MSNVVQAENGEAFQARPLTHGTSMPPSNTVIDYPIVQPNTYLPYTPPAYAPSFTEVGLSSSLASLFDDPLPGEGEAKIQIERLAVMLGFDKLDWPRDAYHRESLLHRLEKVLESLKAFDASQRLAAKK